MAAKRRFELIDGSSRKFWEIWCVGREVHTQYGKIGASGQTTVKKEVDAAAAAKLLSKLVAEKTKKGYLEVRAAGGASAKKPAAKADSKSKAALSLPTAPASKAAKPVAKAGKAPPGVSELREREAPRATPIDLVELMVEQIAKHKQLFRDELEVLGDHASSAPQATVLGWLKKIPKNDGWRCGGAARFAIALFYAGETERASALLAEARAHTPKEAPETWEEHYGETHAHLSLAAAELLLDPAAGQARIDRLRDVEGSPQRHAELVLATLLIGGQWGAAEVAAKAVKEIDFGFARYFRYAVSCALRCDQYDLVGALLSALLGDNSHESAASMVYEHSLRWGRPQDLLELCARFPDTFAKQYVLDALVDCALVDRAKAASFAERISNLEAEPDIVLGCALYRFRDDPEGGARFLKSRTDAAIRHKAFAPLRDAIVGKHTASRYDTVDMRRFRWSKDLVEEELRPSGKLDPRSLGDAIRNAHQLVRIGAINTARELMPKLVGAFEKTPKSGRFVNSDALGYLAGLLGDAKLGDAVSKLVMPSIRVKTLKEVVAGAIEVGDWDTALRVAEKTPDADLNDRMNMICNALSWERWHVRYFCRLS